MVEALIDGNLVSRTAQPERAPRFGMLETVREFGLEALAASGEEPAVRDTHSACFLALAERAAPKLTGPEQKEWLDRLEADHPNLRGALSYFLERDDAQSALGLCVALGEFWYRRGHYAAGDAAFGAALARDGGRADSLVRAEALVQQATIADWLGRYDRAEALLREAAAAEGWPDRLACLADQAACSVA